MASQQMNNNPSSLEAVAAMVDKLNLGDSQIKDTEMHENDFTNTGPAVEMDWEQSTTSQERAQTTSPTAGTKKPKPPKTPLGIPILRPGETVHQAAKRLGISDVSIRFRIAHEKQQKALWDGAKRRAAAGGIPKKGYGEENDMRGILLYMALEFCSQSIVVQMRSPDTQEKEQV